MIYEQTSEKKTNWPIHVLTPNNGKHDRDQFTGTFLLPAQDQVSKLARLTRANDTAGLADMAKTLLVGWDDLSTPKNKAIVYSKQSKAFLLKDPWMLVGVLGAISEIIYGVQQIEETEKEKNL